MRSLHRQVVTRRRFLQACACTAAAGMLGAMGYVVANAPLPPPYSESSAFQNVGRGQTGA
ncbi:MAG: twin-arginine translocation signal domain-containing protein [Roseiflexaceae bacterium]|nr:twin-arginine translocation signal domain-containing protein [Roseiflexaceae bacterium]